MSSDYLGLGARLTAGPTDALATSAFGHELAGIDNLYSDMGLADVAHVFSLAHAELIDAETTGRLLAGLLDMHAAGPDVVEWDPALGDIYNNRTVHLTAQIGNAAKSLHTGRARRESTTVAWHLATRRLVQSVGSATTALIVALVDVSDAHRATVMSDYTYLQHAHPTTLGHYLVGFAQPLLRDAERLTELHRRINQSPAETGSVNGSRLPLDRRRASHSLGFDRPMAHTRDAMWASDLAFESTSAAMSVAITLDRLAEELMIFATEEFGFVEIADQHSRTSVIMPQKKNPYGLAYIRGVARRAIGTMTGVASAQLMPTGQPDSRTVAYLDAIDLLDEVARATSLLAEIVEHARFDAVRMRELAESGHSYATDLCDILLLDHGMSNRSSHDLVGRAIRAATERGAERVDADDLRNAASELGIEQPEIDQSTIDQLADVDALVRTRHTIGGAGPEPLGTLIDAARSSVAEHMQHFASLRNSTNTAEAELIAAAERERS